MKGVAGEEDKEQGLIRIILLRYRKSRTSTNIVGSELVIKVGVVMYIVLD